MKIFRSKAYKNHNTKNRSSTFFCLILIGSFSACADHNSGDSKKSATPVLNLSSRPLLPADCDSLIISGIQSLVTACSNNNNVNESCSDELNKFAATNPNTYCSFQQDSTIIGIDTYKDPSISIISTQPCTPIVIVDYSSVLSACPAISVSSDECKNAVNQFRSQHQHQLCSFQKDDKILIIYTSPESQN